MSGVLFTNDGNLCFKENIEIHDLPSEVILKIFTYLDVYSLTNNVRLVCKSWKMLAEDPSLWKFLSFDKLEDLSNIQKIIAKCHMLNCLKLENCTVDFSLFRTLSDHCPRLQNLEFIFCHISDFGEDELNISLSCLYKLNTLNLEGCSISSCILDVIPHATCLKKLNLSHCFQLTNKTLVSILERCSNLRELNIDGITMLEDSSINQIFKAHSDIESVILDGDYMSDEALTFLDKCSCLDKLSISFCDNLTDDVLSQIQRLSHLLFLRLRKGSLFSAFGLRTMFKNQLLLNLIFLDLSECSQLDDSCLYAIADSCPLLTYLNLSWCWELNDDSVKYIILSCPNLVVLNFTGLVNICGTFLLDLGQEALKKLEILNLEQCGCIKDEELTALIRKRPEIKIFSFWGDTVAI